MSSRSRNFLVAVGGILLLALMGFAVYKLVSGKSAATQKAPKISLIPTTPPPPPPPPKEEKKPEPPKEQKEVKMEQAPPKEAPPAPPSQELKMEGAAGDGPSAFGAGKVTREDLSNLGAKGGGAPLATGMFNPFNNYATALKGELQRYLARNKDLRQRAYRLDIHLWVGRDGNVTRQELVGSSGDTELDDLVRQAISSMGAFSQGPPERMPQPIRLRLVTGGR